MINYLKSIALIAIVALSSCKNESHTTCIIQGDFEEGNGVVKVLPYQEVNSRAAFDSLSYTADIKDGKFELELDAVQACRKIEIAVDGVSYTEYIYSSPGIISLSFDESKDMLVEGNALSDEFQRILDDINYKQYKKAVRSREAAAVKIKEDYKLRVWELVEQNPNSVALSYFVKELYWGAELEMLNKVIDSFSPEIHDTYYLDYFIKKRDRERKTSIGQTAPNFELLSHEGEKIRLEDYRGKYVLIDFWASWCGPCRREIPNLKNIYKHCKEDGLVVLSVSTDAEEQAWLKAVEEENMPWQQVRDDKGISSIYNVTSIPHVLIISPEGKIINKKIYGEEISAALHKEGFRI